MKDVAHKGRGQVGQTDLCQDEARRRGRSMQLHLQPLVRTQRPDTFQAAKQCSWGAMSSKGITQGKPTTPHDGAWCT